MDINVVKENMFALVVASWLSLLLVLVISNVDYLKWDIVWVESSWVAWNSKEQPIEKEWELLMSVDWWKLKLLSNKDIDWIQTLNMVMSYDVDNVELDITEIESPFEYSVWNPSESQINLIFLDISSLTKWQEIFITDFEWDSWMVNISDVSIMFTSWWSDKLSVSFK